MTEQVQSIAFDIAKVEKLKATYEEVISFVLRELPSVNWNSPQAIVNYYKEVFDITIENAKIKTIANLLAGFDEDSLEFEITCGVLIYLRLSYTVKNYLAAILRHQVNGIVNLRLVEGEWRMPNKQPLPYSQEINQCITARNYNV